MIVLCNSSGWNVCSDTATATKYLIGASYERSSVLPPRLSTELTIIRQISQGG